MKNSDAMEIKKIGELQNRIQARLEKLQFQPQDSIGSIVHHLAEVAFLGEKLSRFSLPAFLEEAQDDRGRLADLVVEIKMDLDEMKDAIADMQGDLVFLMNHLNP